MRDYDGIRDLYAGFNRGLSRVQKTQNGDVQRAFFEGAIEAVKSVFGLSAKDRLKSTHRPVKRHSDVHQDWESAYHSFQLEKKRFQESGIDNPDSEILIESVRALGKVDAFCRILDEDVDVELVRSLETMR